MLKYFGDTEALQIIVHGKNNGISNIKSKMPPSSKSLFWLFGAIFHQISFKKMPFSINYLLEDSRGRFSQPLDSGRLSQKVRGDNDDLFVRIERMRWTEYCVLKLWSCITASLPKKKNFFGHVWFSSRRFWKIGWEIWEGACWHQNNWNRSWTSVGKKFPSIVAINSGDEDFETSSLEATWMTSLEHSNPDQKSAVVG